MLRFLIGPGHLETGHLSASGYADTRPRQPNDTPVHRAVNRRVEIVIEAPTPPPAATAPATDPAAKTAAGPAAPAKEAPAAHH